MFPIQIADKTYKAVAMETYHYRSTTKPSCNYVYFEGRGHALVANGEKIKWTEKDNYLRGSTRLTEIHCLRGSILSC